MIISSLYDSCASERTTCIISASLFSWIFCNEYPLPLTLLHPQCVPCFKSFPQNGMIRLQNNDQINPTFRKHFTTMKINDTSTLHRLSLNAIQNLQSVNSFFGRGKPCHRQIPRYPIPSYAIPQVSVL